MANAPSAGPLTARERAALSFTEIVTRLSETHVPTDADGEIAAGLSPAAVAAPVGLVTVDDAGNAPGAAGRAPARGADGP